MTPHPAASDYKDILVFLATAGVVAPLFRRLKISPVLGFLAAGVLLGPQGLGRLAAEHPWARLFSIADANDIEALAEFGVVFLLFMIGLELSWERLRKLRKLVFGLGLLQVAISATALGGAAFLFGVPPVGAAVLGLALALSSTALVMPVLAERRILNSASGRASFAVLLAQDLAVAPILIALTLMGGTHTSLTGLALALAPAALALAVLVVGGRLVLRPLFQSAARTRSPEMFVALSLLVVIGAGVAAQLGGLSMALGAFIAGLLLAETEFRREIEVTIEPFKGLLLGMFFVSVGVKLDLGRLLSEPAVLIALTVGVVALKAAITFVLGRLFRLPAKPALETALVLGPAGEFAFVVVAQALAEGLLGPEAGQRVLVSVSLGLFLVPFMAALAARLGQRLATPVEDLPEAIAGELAAGRVLVIGYGRVGRLVGEMLELHAREFVAVDSDPRLVAAAREEGRTIYFGDAGREEFLKRCGIETVPAVVVTMDAPGKVDDVVRATRRLRPDVTLVARARDAKHAARLYGLGVTDAVPETVEASLQLAENTLVDLGVPMGLVIASVHEKRDEFRRLFQSSAPDGRRTRALKRTRKVSELF